MEKACTTHAQRNRHGDLQDLGNEDTEKYGNVHGRKEQKEKAGTAHERRKGAWERTKTWVNINRIHNL